MRKISVLWLFWAPMACASHADAPPVVPAERAVTPGLLGTDDIFEVRVYGEPDLSGTHRVASDGTVNIPLVGLLRVSNMRPAGLADAIADKLRRYVKDPHVSIFVKEFNSQKVFVFGQVQKPGTFKFEPGMNIVQAITLAGGFAKLANSRGAFVTRVVDGEEKQIRVSVEAIGEGEVPNLLLRPGDIVYVPEALF